MYIVPEVVSRHLAAPAPASVVAGASRLDAAEREAWRYAPLQLQAFDGHEEIRDFLRHVIAASDAGLPP